MADRQAPEDSPLIWATKQAIFAVDPESGALRWRADISELSRLFRLGERLFVLTTAGVSCIDIKSGKPLGAVPLEFQPTAGLATPNRLFVAGPDGAAAVTETGAILWSAKQEFEKGFTTKKSYVCKGHDGTELWKQPVVGSSRYDNPGLLLEEQIAQPDLDSQ